DLGFAAAVRGMAREFAVRAGVKVDLRFIGWRAPRWPAIEETLYRILQECLTNVERHAGARRVRVE
ncbi:MAG TPA: histidine kinase, partial [Opitutaceae bacterium]|nr:histidine kinase [Opitutaceae bacterium]